jgi:outer membrane lipoprotein-sorting protein
MTLRISTLVVAAALCFGATPAPALAQSATLALPAPDLELVNRATAYLQGLKEAQGRFEQTSPRGVVTTGELFLSRPGKARFQYDPPSGLLVVSDGKTVSVYDSRLKTFDRAPLSATPLALLLARRVRLDEDVEVARVGRIDNGFFLTVRKTNGRDNQGYITLMFGEAPTVLRGWTLVDGQGQTTRVKITDLKPESVDGNLFVLGDPRSTTEKSKAP